MLKGLVAQSLHSFARIKEEHLNFQFAFFENLFLVAGKKREKREKKFKEGKPPLILWSVDCSSTHQNHSLW